MRKRTLYVVLTLSVLLVGITIGRYYYARNSPDQPTDSYREIEIGIDVATAVFTLLLFGATLNGLRETTRSVNNGIESTRGRMVFDRNQWTLAIRIVDRVIHYSFKNIGESPVIIEGFSMDPYPVDSIDDFIIRQTPAPTPVYHPLMKGESFHNGTFNRNFGVEMTEDDPSFGGLPVTIGIFSHESGRQRDTAIQFVVRYSSLGLIYELRTAVHIRPMRRGVTVHPSPRFTSDRLLKAYGSGN